MSSSTLLAPLAQAGTYYRIPLNPNGVAPGEGSVQFDPGSIAFADQKIGTTSAAQTVTLANTGNTDVALTPFDVSGPFSATSNCGLKVAAATSCTYSVTYTASAMGSESGQLLVKTSAGDQKVQLSGFGLQTSDSASLGSLAFRQPVATVSDPKSVTLTNTGNTAVAINAVSVAGAPYSVSHNCPASLAVGGSCVANITFAPSVMGEADGTLSFSTAGGDQRVILTGMGLQGVPELSRQVVDFGNVPVNSISQPQTITLSNTGNDAVGVSGVTTNAPFAIQANNCGSAVAPGASCSFGVTLSPSSMGAVSGKVNLALSTGALAVDLSGSGQQTSGATSTPSLDFGNVKVGTSSDAKSVTLNNTGNTPLTVAVSTPAGADSFAATTDCPATLAVGSSCTVNTDFKPSAMGDLTGRVLINTNAAPYAIDVKGTGLLAKPAASPANLSFADQTVGTSSSAQTVTLTNAGNLATAVGAPNFTGPFSATSNCSTSLGAGASCTYSVVFTPSTMNAATGSMTVATDAGAQTVTFSGRGLQTSGAANAGSLSFGSQDINTTSSAQTLTLSNTGNTPLAVNSISGTGQFGVTHNCPATVDVGASCSVNVAFSPTSMGAQAGAVTLNTNGGTSVVSLSGTGLQAVASVSPLSVDFGSQPLGVASTAKTVTLSNSGNKSMTVNAANVSGLVQWSVTTSCGSTLAAGASCVYNGVYTPKNQGAATESFTVSTSGGSQKVSMSGVGTQVVLSASPTSRAFGNVQVGQTSALAVTVTNTGNLPATNLSFSAPTGYSQANTCSTSLAAGASCQVTITFAPSAAQAYTGNLTMTSGGASTSVALSGTGAAAQLTNVTGTNINMGSNMPADSSTVRAFYFKNTGYGPVTIGAHGMVSGNLTSWVGGTIGDGTCNQNTVLQPGQQCQIQLVMAGAGSYTGTAYVNSNAPQVQFSAYGTAVAPYFSDANMGTILANSSTAKTVTLTNPAADAFRNVSINVSWPYSVSNNGCGATLAAGASCAFTLTFNPQSNVGTWNGAYLTASGFHYQMADGVENTGWQPGNAAYGAAVFGTGSPFCTSSAAAWGGPSSFTFDPNASAPNCHTFLVLVVGGGGGGATGGGGGGSGYVGVQWINLYSAASVNIGAGGGPDANGGSTCFASVCAGGGNAGVNGRGGYGGSGGGLGSTNRDGNWGWGGNWGGNSSDGTGLGQGNYSGALGNFRYNPVAGAAGGYGANDGLFNYTGGGGGGGILFQNWGPGGGNSVLATSPPSTNATGGAGWGGGGAGGFLTGATRGIRYSTPGTGAQGLVYIEWFQ
ncbi:beta strand repeat-containing protein [Burkholderia cenocepacia]|uniref:beta strand repeat-containing protein n=1 Tax=Burkholderia cenocepacia TaxID=95486 RepID=UPI001365D815|nr:choice-of-anchor D domain-containing protein [Burkholderia cenocepacia]